MNNKTLMKTRIFSLSVRLLRMTLLVMGIVLLDYATAASAQSYTTLSGQYTSYTFNNNSTYYISAPAEFSGTVTFNPGCVIKFASNAYLLLYGPITCNGNGASPSIFTDMNDNVSGQTISGSTGYPTYSAQVAVWLYYDTSPITLNGLKIRWAQTAIRIDSNVPSQSNTIENCSIEFSQTGVYLWNSTAALQSSTKCSVETPVTGRKSWSYTGSLSEQCTPGDSSFKNGLLFYWDGSSTTSKINNNDTLTVYNPQTCQNHNPPQIVLTDQTGGILSKTFQSQDEDCSTCDTVEDALLGDSNMATQMNGGSGVSFTMQVWFKTYPPGPNQVNGWQCQTFSYLISKIDGNFHDGDPCTTGDWSLGGGNNYISWGCVQASNDTSDNTSANTFKQIQITNNPGTVWHQFIVGYDNSSKEMFAYYDNSLVGTRSCNGVTATGQQVALFNDPGRLFDQSYCYITEVGFWNRVLTQGERGSLYNNGAALSYDDF